MGKIKTTKCRVVSRFKCCGRVWEVADGEAPTEHLDELEAAGLIELPADAAGDGEPDISDEDRALVVAAIAGIREADAEAKLTVAAVNKALKDAGAKLVIKAIHLNAVLKAE